MASIRKKGPEQWQAQIRRAGWPSRSATFRTRNEAEAWARSVERDIDLGRCVDQTLARETTLRALIETYIAEVTLKRPGEASRNAEGSRLRRFMRNEKKLCAHAVANLRPEHVEAYRDRRLATQLMNGKTHSGATVNRELTMLKRVIDYARRSLGLQANLRAPDVRLLHAAD